MSSKPSISIQHRGDDVAVLSHDFNVCSAVVMALRGRAVHSPPDSDQLFDLVAGGRAQTILIDADCPGAADVLRRIAQLPERQTMFVILLAHDPIGELPSDADLVIVHSAMRSGLAITNPMARNEHPPAFDRVVGVSMLGKPLDRALEEAADELAAGFRVERCLISVREDSTGAAASGTGTWSSLTWSYAAERCRAAAQTATPLIAPVPDMPGDQCETYVAVPLETALGETGFLGLVASGPRRFGAGTHEVLRAVARRLATELRWRGVHERATDELDRLVNGPALDPLIGTWNHVGLKQLTAMQLSSAARNGLPLTVAVLDVVDLQGINHRHGHEVGDRVLRRVADAIRTTVREEDVVGRWAGDAIALVLHGIGPEGGARVAERLQVALAARPLELAGMASLLIPVTVGVATHETNEDAVQLLTRAASAATKAQAAGAPFLHAGSQLTNPRLSGEIPLLSQDIASTIGGTYRLLHEISRGGMGVVYRAQDRALERPVAIKMLRPDLADDPELVEKFRFEAAMLAQIRHPNLVQIYSFGHTGGDSYFVMELVEGESLEQACERHQSESTAMPLAEVPNVISQIASALDALHERGIVHRDVKPANVILDPFRNRSVLVDVGIARRYGQDARSAGTPGFVAPEVLGGGEASARSDVYGLAATAYTMLTLKRPWGEGALMTQIARQCANELQKPSELRPELVSLDDVLLRALNADPEKRPGSARAFAKELVDALPVVLPRDRRTSDSAMMPLRKTVASLESPKTRGVVFRSVARALGGRDAERLRDAISGGHSELAQALSDSAPLVWLPTELLSRLFAIAAQHTGRDSAGFARDVAKVTVRGSFRRFFPASAATLVPESTLSAIRNVWNRYHKWGDISSMPVQPTEHVVRLRSTLRDPTMCAWTSGMLEQLVILSGAKQATVAHENCQITGDEACLFRVRWER